MTEPWLRELDRFSSLLQEQKAIWLSQLLYFVSMLARDTYEIGTDSVGKPVELRRFNELLHRISRKQIEILLNETVGMPDKQFFAMISEEVEQLGIDSEGLIERLK